MPRDGEKVAQAPAESAGVGVKRAPVLAIGLGRGKGGKSTVLAEMAWRALAQGRKVIVADGDVRSKTLSKLFPDALRPLSEEMPDMKSYLTMLLNRIVKEQSSAVCDLGGGDRVLLELGRELRLVEFCRRRGIEPLAVYCLGSEDEDLAHIHNIFEAGYFRPEHSIILMNEGIIPSGKSVVGAFEGLIEDPRFTAIVKAGAKPMFLTRLPCIDLVMKSQVGFYEAASGSAGLDPVEEFQVEDWCADFEAKRAKVGAIEWMP